MLYLAPCSSTVDLSHLSLTHSLIAAAHIPDEGTQSKQMLMLNTHISTLGAGVHMTRISICEKH